MPRKPNSQNSSYYHYIVHTKNDDNEIIQSQYHKTQKEITDTYGLNRSAIYYIINPVENRIPRITRNYIIEKCLVPVFQMQITTPIIPITTQNQPQNVIVN